MQRVTLKRVNQLFGGETFRTLSLSISFHGNANNSSQTRKQTDDVFYLRKYTGIRNVLFLLLHGKKSRIVSEKTESRRAMRPGWNLICRVEAKHWT